MYGEELRKKIIAARNRGIPVKEICLVTEMSPPMVYALCKLQRETGSVIPRPRSGRKPRLDEAKLHQIELVLMEKSDITMEELKGELDLPISTCHLSRIVHKKLGYTYKKRWFTPLNKIDQMYRPNENSGW